MSYAARERIPFMRTLLAARFRYLLLATVIFGASVFIVSTNRRMNVIFDEHKPSYKLWKNRNVSKLEQSHTIRTEGCSIPAMEPLNESVKKYVAYPSEQAPCINSSLRLLDSDKNKIWVIKENLLQYNINQEPLSCCYQAFYRPTEIKDITSTHIDDRAKYDDCLYFNDTINVLDEFVRVKCSLESRELYQQYFLFAPKKEFIEHDGKAEKSKTELGYNVLVLGIDAVSRLNLHRTMPKTIKYLKSKGAVEMLGYNKVGDNTFPNLIPMLIGIRDNELRKVCLPHKRATFDNCPFVWEWFKQAGYYTALAEDTSNLGTFNYVKVGFSNTPTDYYIHTFIHEADKHVGSNKDFNDNLCMQDKHFYKVLLDYAEDLTTTLESSKLFGFFWETTMSHDYLNYPMVMDDDYVQFFNNLEAKSYLNDTIVIFVSDHGIRWGDIRSTKQGRLEERLPFLFMLTPPSFRENYKQAYENLKLNSKRLATPFDLHATLSDLVELNKSIDNDVLLSRSNTSYGHERSISLFLPIPSNRTCKMADIDDHWCTCHRDVTISKTSPEAIEAAINLFSFLNEMLQQYPQCARLSLANVLDVTMKVASEPMLEKEGWQEFMIVVEASPGDGIFEATLRKDSDKWMLVGTVSRLNLYGDQSRCVNDYQLKLYCYCD